MGVRAEAIATLFPPEAAVEDAAPSTTRATLFPEEEPAVARAIDRRRREFAAARACARRAMGRLGLPPLPVPTDGRRAPVWPAGVVGSISHTGDYCAAVVARLGSVRSIGLDVEADEAVKGRLWDRICTEAELGWISTQPPDRHGWWVRLVFSAKEAFYKCQYGLTETYLGFHEVELSVDPESSRWIATLSVDAGDLTRGTRIGGGWVVSEGILATGCWLPSTWVAGRPAEAP